jgi:2-dehydro-3-deoxyglucarate aldolase/4-hydroxy-2-oxoheptanedioate aldolase
MRENKVKRTLAAGGTSIGTMCLEFATTGLGRLCASAGAEFAVFDMEHSGWSMETIRMLMASTRSTDMIPLVRPPVNEYHFIARALDMGAMGIVSSFINTPEQARQLVASCKYPPLGRRGTAFSVSHDDYSAGDIPEKMRSANNEILVVAQIETLEGANNVEAIAAVEGVDVVWIGQFDLTTSMGIPGQVKHPEFLKVSTRILKACQNAGKAAGFGSLFIDDVITAREEGFRFLVYTADLWIFQQALRRGLRKIRTGSEEE